MNQSQDYYWRNKTRRNLILKPRQKGLSKIIDADQLIDCIKKSTNAVVISHEKGATTRLFNAVKFYIDNIDVKPVTSIDNKAEIKFPKADSVYFIGTAGQKAFGRGDTLDRVHLSEFAFYEQPERILAGVSEAAEYGQIDIETTPNGRNFFYDLWLNAKRGDSPYTCIFIPWFIDHEYSVSAMTEAEKKGLSASVQQMFADDKFILNSEEKLFIQKVKAEYKTDLTPDQIKWRRYKIWDRGNLFFQEYPEDDVSCFLASGRSVFVSIRCEPYLKIDLENPTAEQETYLSSKILYAGIDGAEGTMNGDRHCFSVIDVAEKATCIYEYTSNEPIDVFWLRINKILKKYRFILGVEKNGVGVAHVNQAKALGVPLIEWNTTATNRPVMITDLEEAYRKEELIETYTEAENELRDMIYTTNNRPEAAKGKHDDRVLARAIAFQIRKTPRPAVSML